MVMMLLSIEKTGEWRVHLEHLWTTLHAVLAGGALDGGHGVDEGARLFYCFQLIIVHGLEISERAQVFLHLIRTRHTGQNSNDPVQ